MHSTRLNSVVCTLGQRLDSGWMVAALLPIIGVLPTLSNGIARTADGPLHVQRIYAMSVLLGAGNLWPRWVPYFHLGFGYPIFNFYPPGVFYLGGLLVLLGFSATAAFTIVAAFAWGVGSVGMYALARQFLPGHASLLAATLWAYAPSRLYEVWDQGSLPQMMAAACIPWLFWGIVLAARQPSCRHALAVALPFAGIALSHQPITFIAGLYAAPAALLLPLWSARQQRQTLLARWLCTLGGIALGVALAAIFLLPLAMELQYVQAARGREDNVSYLISNYLRPDEIFSQPQPMDLGDMRYELPTTLGLVGGLLAIPGFLALIRQTRYALALLLGLALAFTLFMLLEVSLPVWLAIPYFRQLRFSERFLRIGAVLLGLAGGASLLWLPRRWQGVGLAAAMAVVIAAVLPMAYPGQPTVQWENLSALDEIEMELSAHIWGTTSYDEFDPVWGESIPLPQYVPEPEQYVPDPLRIVVFRNDLNLLRPALQESQEIATGVIRAVAAELISLRLHQYYFPGWTATLDGQPVEIYPDSQYGLITVDVPPGEHIIEAHYTGTTVQGVGAAISLLAVGIMAVLFYTGRKQTALASDTACHRLPRRTALAVSGSVLAFALVNAFYVNPNTLWFRHHSPPGDPIYMRQAVRLPFGDAFELLGYTLERDSVAPGDILPVTLFWRARRTIDREYRPVVQLVNLNQTTAWAVSEPFFPGGGNTIGYTPERFASEVHELRVFGFALPYVARLRVQMMDVETGEPLRLPDGADRLMLDPLIRIQGNGTSAAHTLDYTLGDALALDCASASQRDSQLRLDLYWRVLRTPERDLTAFVHALDSQGNLVAQGDAVPLDGDYPATLWLPGQTLADQYTLPFDPAITQIALGLYTTDGRLSVTQNGQRVLDDRIVLPVAETPCLR